MRRIDTVVAMTTDQTQGARLFEMMQDLACQMSSMHTENQIRFPALETSAPVIATLAPSDGGDSTVTSRKRSAATVPEVD